MTLGRRERKPALQTWCAAEVWCTCLNLTILKQAHNLLAETRLPSVVHSGNWRRTRKHCLGRFRASYTHSDGYANYRRHHKHFSPVSDDMYVGLWSLPQPAVRLVTTLRGWLGNLTAYPAVKHCAHSLQPVPELFHIIWVDRLYIRQGCRLFRYSPPHTGNFYPKWLKMSKKSNKNYARMKCVEHR